jgi:membrane-associated phospholipid phosphatase
VLIALPWRFRFGIAVAASVTAGGVIHKIIKMLVDRPRPSTMDMFITVDGQSFPSGHANGGLIFYFMLAILIGRMLTMQNNKTTALLVRAGAVVLVLLIGFSRVYLGVHYPSDVLAGWLLGALLTIVFITLYDHYWPKRFRISYDIPNWDPIPRDSEKRKGWRKPAKRAADEDRLDFPKKTGDWKYPGEGKKKQKREAPLQETRKREPLYVDPTRVDAETEEEPIFKDRPARPARPPGTASRPPGKTPKARPPRRPLV